jgi:outer membrane receptor protein involved in Fe transport
MKKIIYAFCCTVLCLSLSAQKATITGRVTDEKGEGLIQANIVIDASKGMATVTDFDGNYELSVPPGTYDVTYRYIGKEEATIKMTLTDGQKKLQNVTLKDKEKMMEQVVVSGSKYARKLKEETVSMDVIKGSTLLDQNITSLDAGVQKIPGVTIADGQANIRGGAGWSYGAGSRVAILYDGLPVTTADADDAKWSVIPMEQVEQVEVIKGAASALYGSGALNGIINAITAWPTDQPYTQVQTYFGFYGNPPTGSMRWWLPGQIQYFSGFTVADRRKVGQVDISTAAGYTADKGYLDSSDAYDMHLNVKVRWRSKKIEGLSMGINAVAYYSWGKTFFLWDSTGSKGYEPTPGTITIYHDGRYIIDPFLNYFDKNDNRFSFKYRYLNSTNLNTTGQGSIGLRNYAELQYGKSMKNIDFNFIGGLVGIYDIAHAPPGDSVSLIGNHNRGNFAVYAQADKRFFKRLNTTLGVRWEYFNVDDTLAGSHNGRKSSLSSLPYPLARVGLNYQAAEGTFLRASAGMSFRFPSLAEMYVSTLNPVPVYSDPNLQPEKGYSAEVGARQLVKLGRNWGAYGDVALFLNEYQNMMEFTFGEFGTVKDPLLGLGFSSQNIGDARILGTDIGGGVSGKIGDFDLNFVAGYTYIDPRSLNWNDSLHLYNSEGQRLAPTSLNVTYSATSSSTTNVLKYRSKNQLKLILTVDYKFLELNADYQYLGFQQNIDGAFVSPLLQSQETAFKALALYRDNQIANGSKGYNILNIAIGFKATAKFKISAIVKNVANTEWMTRPGMFQAPRNYTLQLSYRF